jgi:hypothetical protein
MRQSFEDNQSRVHSRMQKRPMQNSRAAQKQIALSEGGAKYPENPFNA